MGPRCGGTFRRRFWALWGRGGGCGEREAGKRHQGGRRPAGSNLLSAIHAGLFHLPVSLSATRPLANVIPDLIIDLVSWCPSGFPVLKHKDVLD